MSSPLLKSNSQSNTSFVGNFVILYLIFNILLLTYIVESNMLTRLKIQIQVVDITRVPGLSLGYFPVLMLNLS